MTTTTDTITELPLGQLHESPFNQRLSFQVDDLPKRADWKHDVHAYECYTCDQRGTAPLRNKQCHGCINRPTRPHWKPHPDYAAAAQKVILQASGKTPNDRTQPAPTAATGA